MNCVFGEEEIEFAFDEMLEMPELDEIAFLDCEEGAIVDRYQLATEDPYCACEQSTYWAGQHEAKARM